LTVYSPPVAEQDLEVAADSYNFGTVPVGSHGDWILKLSNVGGVSLLINDISSDDECYYCTTPKFPKIVEPGDFLYVNVRFEPTRNGSIAGTITIETDDPDPNEEFCTIDLTGRGSENAAPVIASAGFVGGYLSAGESGNLTVQADIYDPDGDSEITDVHLFIGTLGGVQVASYDMYDDGQHEDGASDDGVYGISFWVDTVPAGVYVFEILAVDSIGACSDIWPYMRIDGDVSVDNIWGLYPTMGTTGDKGVAYIYRSGFDGTSMTQQDGGPLRCTAEVDDFLDGSSVDRVEVRFMGAGVGLSLHDDGQGADEAAGDEVFTGEIALGPGYPAGDYLLEMVAIDGSGQESVASPFYVVR